MYFTCTFLRSEPFMQGPGQHGGVSNSAIARAGKSLPLPVRCCYWLARQAHACLAFIHVITCTICQFGELYIKAHALIFIAVCVQGSITEPLFAIHTLAQALKSSSLQSSGWRNLQDPAHTSTIRVCNRLSGYSGYSDIRKNLSVRIAV